MSVNEIRRVVAVTLASAFVAAATAQAQVPPAIAEGLRKIGQIVDPACTAVLYRPLMPKNDFNTYWPPDAAAPASTSPLYPGITIARDQSFGPDPKDVLDIFTSDRGGNRRDVLIYVPGGAGNKIEQQAREANAFYDNIGRWAAKNGMVGVLVQRHPGQGNWDDGGRDISMAVDWLKANVGKYRGNSDRMFIWAHSAGNGPLGVYVGHPDRWKNGVAVKGAIFMSGNPVPGAGGGGGRGAAPAPGAAAPAAPPAGARAGGAGGGPAAGSACGLTGGAGASNGAIAGPSGQREGRGGGAGAPGGAGRGGGRGGQALTPEQQAERDNLPGFKATNVKIMLARAELDPGVMGEMTAADKALHDTLCAVDGPKSKDGVGHCPTMFFVKNHSHMSEVFSPDTPDKTVTDPILSWIKKIK